MNNPNEMDNKMPNQQHFGNDDIEPKEPIINAETEDIQSDSASAVNENKANEWKAPDNIVDPVRETDKEEIPASKVFDSATDSIKTNDVSSSAQPTYTQPQNRTYYGGTQYNTAPSQPAQSARQAQPQNNYGTQQNPTYYSPSGAYYNRPNSSNGYYASQSTTQPNMTNNSQANQGSYSYSQPKTSNSYTSQNSYNAGTQSTQYSSGVYSSQAKAVKPKKKKEKRKYSIGSVIAISLCFAIICSTITGGISYYATQNSIDNKIAALTDGSVANNSTVESINITGDTESLIPAVAKKAAPSVVGVRVTTTSSYYSFFGMGGSQSEGSGVIYTEDGYIITNYHVIADAVEGSSNSNYSYGFGFGFGYDDGGSESSTVSVFLPSDPDTEIPAEIIGYDVSADVAVLKINKNGLPAIEIADSDEISVGDTTVAIGNPGGLDFMGSVSTGIVSGLNRTLSTENGIEMNLIQTDAAINPGNSGGALVNSKGQLIGINNSKISGDGFEGMGFAIPSNTVIEIVERLINQENQPTAYLGVTIDTNYTASALQSMGYPAGVVVFSVTEGSPAYNAGIQQYDIITAINGTPITTYAQLNSEKNKYSPGDTISVTIYRNGQTADAQVTLGTSQSVTE